MIETELAAGPALLRAHGSQLRVDLLVLGLIFGDRRFQILERECQLIIVYALGFAAEVGAADLCNKMLELRVACGELVALDSINTLKDQMAARKLIGVHARPQPDKLADPAIALRDTL